MSNALATVLFEYPLNEKTRTWLRLESLLHQLHENHSWTDMGSALAFFRAVADLLDVLERGDIRTELLKELERQQQKLLQWSDVPGVDHDRIVSLVRQRLSIPGGCCSFDVPTLHLWLHQPQTQKDQMVSAWMDSLSPLKNALEQVLELIRHSGTFRPQISLNGFFQDNAVDADLLRLHLDIALQLYPQISGHKSRYAIRFLPLDSDNGQTPARLTFDLACC